MTSNILKLTRVGDRGVALLEAGAGQLVLAVDVQGRHVLGKDLEIGTAVWVIVVPGR